MSSLERLPPDQRAVLALVLQRGKSYDDIAGLLAIDRAAVRDRALSAIDALGPSEPQVPAAQRALITDYLLGQLPDRVREEVRGRLATSPPERAWARVLAGELSSLADGPLPEIPSAQAVRAPEPEPAPDPEPEAEPEPEPERATVAATAPAAAPVAATPASAPAAARAQSTGGGRVPPPTPAGRPADRRTGTILLLLAVVIVAVVVIVVAVSSGGSSHPKHHATTHPSTATTPPPTTPSTTPTTSTTAVTPKIVAKIVLHPLARSSKAVGAADVVIESNVTGVIVAAQHLPPNTKHNAYAVWLAAPGGASHLLGYVSPPVGKSGNLSTTGPLPSDASSYTELLVTIETTAGTKTPGPAVLEGTLSLGG